MTLSAEDFRDIVGAIRVDAHTSADERRNESRADVHGNAIIILCGVKEQRTPVTVEVCDLSVVGIGIRYSRPLSSGRQFILFLPGRDGKVRGIVCRVARWQPVGENLFEIGATFEQHIAVERGVPDGQRDIRALEQRLAAMS